MSHIKVFKIIQNGQNNIKFCLYILFIIKNKNCRTEFIIKAYHAELAFNTGD